MVKAFLSLNIGESTCKLPQRNKTSNMQIFMQKFYVTLNHCHKLLLEQEKMTIQVDQVLSKVLNYLKFCYSNAFSGWNVPKTFVDYCLESSNMLSDFVQCSQNDWEIGYLVIFGSGMLLIICLIFKKHLVILRRFLFFPASEIYFQKVKCFLSKKMKLQWNEDLTL